MPRVSYNLDKSIFYENLRKLREHHPRAVTDTGPWQLEAYLSNQKVYSVLLGQFEPYDKFVTVYPLDSEEKVAIKIHLTVFEPYVSGRIVVDGRYYFDLPQQELGQARPGYRAYWNNIFYVPDKGLLALGIYAPPGYP
jgi:hypothetical protein